MYDFCVIGAGMIGSAAAKYLSEKSGSKVALVGTTEPNREDYKNYHIFGAHYDEGRITRNLDSNPLWGHVARESIKRYREIEHKSGINFFTENGYLVIGDQNSEQILDNKQCAQKLGIPIQIIPSTELIARQFPYLSPLPGMSGVYEMRDSGTINPRQLVQAQLQLFHENRGRFITNIARGVVQNPITDDSWTIKTAGSGYIQAKKLLICPGAFLSHLEERPEILGRIDLRPRTALAARIRVDDPALRRKLANSMPSIYFSSKNEYEKHPGLQEDGLKFYMLAPVAYPDGHWYLKLGMEGECYFKSPQEISNWFWNGPHTQQAIKEGEILKRTAKSFIPELDTSHTILDTCAITMTPNEHPYIDRVDKNLYVACGGNGWAAKSSDELGRLAAELSMQEERDLLKNSMLGSFSRKAFKCHYLAPESTATSRQSSKI